MEKYNYKTLKQSTSVYELGDTISHTLWSERDAEHGARDGVEVTFGAEHYVNGGEYNAPI